MININFLLTIVNPQCIFHFRNFERSSYYEDAKTTKNIPFIICFFKSRLYYHGYFHYCTCFYLFTIYFLFSVLHWNPHVHIFYFIPRSKNFQLYWKGSLSIYQNYFFSNTKNCCLDYYLRNYFLVFYF